MWGKWTVVGWFGFFSNLKSLSWGMSDHMSNNYTLQTLAENIDSCNNQNFILSNKQVIIS